MRSKKEIRIGFIGVLILLFSVLVSVGQNSVIERIEPPFWWSGMENSNLQLLVYGDNIGNMDVSIKDKSIELVKVIKVENQNYLFLDLFIKPDANAGQYEIEFSSDKKKHISEYELLKRNTGSKERKGFDDSDVIYLLMPDRFANGNPENDDVKGMLEKADRKNHDGRHGGDILGIKNKLDYLNELGVTSVWINPLLENNHSKYSYHGYAITDFYKVDARFGSNEDYKNLVETAHSKNMKIIMDMVFNHCGTGYWWHNDLPSYDWLNQWPEFTRSNYRGGTVTDPYASDFDKDNMIKGWFDVVMADLNQSNPLVANYLIQNSIWWIEYVGLDGIRMDTYPYSYKEFMAEWMQRVLEEYPDFNVIGESWLPDPGLVAYWMDNETNKDGYKSNVTNVFDFPLMYAISAAFNEEDNWNDGVVKLYDILGQDFLYSDPTKLVVFADNHDGDRLFTKLGEDINKFKMAMAFVLTTRGIPEIYYGTEILMTGYEHHGHGHIRKDFPGGWSGDKNDAFTTSGRTDKQNEAFNYLKKLLNWRKNKDVIHHGQLKHFIPENGIYVYFRYNDNEKVMVVFNNSDKDQTIDYERFTESLDGFSSGYSVIDDKNISDLKNIQVNRKSALIIELKK